ncbi:LPXTG cell wall anchor domain-containing protein [Jiangella rhizosphaerae]|uniref:LPXTG cell wall anchor domain-containing protein n=2 Tax=Jiangella rhizosphaerae TaxID=2293569 RepID=A0A418KNF2_9ACTN|nr:LPXTG cell wall anchor domain-containing protein [Jiangella rhizosphaerae]
MRFIGRATVRALAGAGLIGATALGLAGPAAAEEQPVYLAVSIADNLSGPPGATLEVMAGLSVMGGQDMDGWSTDFTVPDGVTITGIVDDEILPGTERPDEGCALATPQRLECHSNDTVAIGEDVDTRFEITLDDDASGDLGAATFTVTADEGWIMAAEATVRAVADEVVIEAFLDPGDFEGAPGTTFEQTVRISNTGAVDMVGYSLDFFAGGGVTITGLTELELVDGTERPDEGCVLTDVGRAECHTGATLGAGETTEVTFQLRLPETADYASLGDTHVHVFGDNGGDFSDVAMVGLDVDTTSLLDVSATPEVAGRPGQVVEIVMEATNVGPVDAAARKADVEVPAGATVVGVNGFAVGEIPPELGCLQESPRQISCTRDTVIVPGDTEELTFQVRLDDDAPAGELGVATLTDSGYGGTYETQTVVTVTAADGAETGDDDGGAAGGGAGGHDGEELPDTGTSSTTVAADGAETGDDDGGAAGGGAGGHDGEELPDTGTSSTTVALTALGLLLAGGAVLALRARRA